MEPHPRDPGRTAWALPCLLLLALPGVGAQLGQGFSLQQPQTKVSVAAGETVTLNCTTSGIAEPGPVRWLKGWDRGNKTIYDQTTKDPSSRVTRAMNKSKTDFTIHIRNVQPEDTGTYYCVKFVKSDSGVDQVFQRGDGTEVSVLAKPSPPLVSGPEQRAEPGQSVPFTCTTGGFFPKEIGVKWFKNKDPMVAQPPQVTESRVKTYNISSTVMVTLQEDDVRSQLICEVQHPTLLVPLQGRYQLSRVLRVPPSVEVLAEPSPVEVNKTVTFTCLVKKFYPANVSVSWLENGSEIKVENISRPVELPQGLFELRSQVEVQATEEKNGSTIVCVVVHDGRAPASYSAFLWTSNPGQGGLSKGFQMDKGDMLIYIVVGVVCTVLALLVAAILYLIRTKQIKGKSSPSARLHEPEKSSEATTQESDPNNLTYADLNFDKERKTIRRMVEMSQQSEYACIQTNQAPNGDDNLTYADLDMVHLSKAPKRPAPRPEEASSEYASVQITRK
ncbi:tyrosine-protein phosphatase non-receptor type substrate 1-like isoform X2 [Hirundo rustica]|nr:tyrosine-protein phosphatase non-receptor type substrate 1-like isoform X1 [Hirundo rustica]XP_058278698.1 tyrosine-protein phosphatase non-receptor type substrate 1-like isoform X2 [Hirundo rustica]